VCEKKGSCGKKPSIFPATSPPLPSSGLLTVSPKTRSCTFSLSVSAGAKLTTERRTLPYWCPAMLRDASSSMTTSAGGKSTWKSL
jgi:hypothetical protein